jgi:hypothetical protein
MALIAGAFAVALLPGRYCISFSWLGLRLAGERARMPISMTVDESCFTWARDPQPWTSPGRRHGASSAESGHLFVYCVYPRAFLVPERAFGPGQLDRFLAPAGAGHGRPTTASSTASSPYGSMITYLPSQIVGKSSV